MGEHQHEAGRQGQHVLSSGGGAALGCPDEQTHDMLCFPPRLVEDGAPAVEVARAAFFTLPILEFRFWILDCPLVSLAGLVDITPRFRFWILGERGRRIRTTDSLLILDRRFWILD